MTTGTIYVAVVDDHPVVVGGLAAGLAAHADIELVARGATIAEARELLSRRDIDVVLLDVRLLDGNGIQVLSERREGGPHVLVVSTFDQSQYIAAAVRFGAKGYVSKTTPIAELAAAIRSVAGGSAVFTEQQLGKAFVALTPAERRVLELAIRGASNREIGSRMGISAKTVEGHLSEIFERYGILGGRTELTWRAMNEGWLEIEPPRSAQRTARYRR